jgi:hypothetical protein
MPDFGAARREAGTPWNAAGADHVLAAQEQTLE